MMKLTLKTSAQVDWWGAVQKYNAEFTAYRDAQAALREADQFFDFGGYRFCTPDACQRARKKQKAARKQLKIARENWVKKLTERTENV